MIRRPPRSTLSSSSAASDVYKRQPLLVSACSGRRQRSEIHSVWLTRWSPPQLWSRRGRHPPAQTRQARMSSELSLRLSFASLVVASYLESGMVGRVRQGSERAGDRGQCAELPEIGADQRWPLFDGYLGGGELLDPAAPAEAADVGRTKIAGPLGVAVGGHQVSVSLVFKHGHRHGSPPTRRSVSYTHL